jgi:manganese oxidase
MPVPPIGRRQFVASAGGTLFCTLAGHRISSNSKVDLDHLGASVPVPPKVAAAYEQGAHAEFVSDSAAAVTPAPGGQIREYWIKAVKTPWDIVPTHHDGMMDSKVTGKTRFTALAYRPYSPNFAKPLGPPQIPGPLLEAETGDTIVMHFRNEAGTPVTMHPHGIFSTTSMPSTCTGTAGWIPTAAG